LRLRKGSLFSKEKPYLICNKPFRQNGVLNYTFSQPLTESGIIKTAEQEGWQLKTDYFVHYECSDDK